MRKYMLVLLLGLFTLSGCAEREAESAKAKGINPAAEGFNMEDSDEKAMAIADSVMEAMGGRQNWDETNIISWNFFGRRSHTWSKNSGRDRIVIPSDSLIIDLNVDSREGTVLKNGEEMTQPDSLQKYLNMGYEMWANDSYWLLMPYKLKDSGVTLNYMGMDTTQAGMPAHKLKLTFDNVGVTPDNMYHVYVDTTDYMVRQWAYFPEANMAEPRFVLPWDDYKNYDGVMISGNRGPYTLSDIKVMDEWPEANE